MDGYTRQRTTIQIEMKKNKISLSFDVEDWYHTPVITGYSFSKYRTVPDFFNDWKEPYDCLTDAFVELMALLEKKNVTATFFVVADVLERYPEIVTLLKASKHEIACHSLHHQIPLNAKTKEVLQTKEQWEKELLQAKEQIESCFGRKIIGYRAPGAYFANWMVDILVNAGFKYDSSVAYNSIYNKTNVKLSNITTSSYYINPKTLDASEPASGLIELPWSYLNINGLRLPAGGAFFYRIMGNAYFKFALNQCLAKGDTMFYMHPLDFSEKPFPLHNHFKRPMYWLNKGRKSLTMMSHLIDSFEGQWATCEEIYNRAKA